MWLRPECETCRILSWESHWSHHTEPGPGYLTEGGASCKRVEPSLKCCCSCVPTRSLQKPLSILTGRKNLHTTERSVILPCIPAKKGRRKRVSTKHLTLATLGDLNARKV